MTSAPMQCLPKNNQGRLSKIRAHVRDQSIGVKIRHIIPDVSQNSILFSCSYYKFYHLSRYHTSDIQELATHS